MNPGYTSVAICSRIDCKTLNIGRSALPDTALSTSAYRFKIAITSCATAYTVSSNTSRTSSTAFANASSSGNSSTFGSKRFTAANCRSSVRSFVDRYGADANINASAPNQRDEIRSLGIRKTSSAPRHSMVERASVVAPALCSRLACSTSLPWFPAFSACFFTIWRAEASACSANLRCNSTNDLPVPSTLTGPRACRLPC